GCARGVPSEAAELALRARTVLASPGTPRTHPGTVGASRRKSGTRWGRSRRTAKCFLPPACSTHLTAEKGRRILSHAKGRPATITVARDVGHSWRRRELSERSEFRSLQKECPARPRRITSTAGKRHKS